MADSVELIKAYISLGVQGEIELQDKLVAQEQKVQNLINVVGTGRGLALLKWQQDVAKASEKATAAFEKEAKAAGLIKFTTAEKKEMAEREKGQQGKSVGHGLALRVAGGSRAAGGGAMGMLSNLGYYGAAAAAMIGATRGLAGKSNPVAGEMFDRTLNDVMAVMGRSLVPVLNLVTKAFRLFGDVLASILPSGAEMEEMLKPMGESLKDLRRAIEPVIPIMKNVLMMAVQALVKALEWCAKAAITAYEFTSSPVKALKLSQIMEKFDKDRAELLKSYGGDQKKMEREVQKKQGGKKLHTRGEWEAEARRVLNLPTHNIRSSVGASNYGQPQFQSFIGYQQQARATALRQGGMSSEEVQKGILQATKDNLEALKKLVAAQEKVAPWVGD